MLAFLGFPLGGFLALVVVGSMEGLVSGALGGRGPRRTLAGGAQQALQDTQAPDRLERRHYAGGERRVLRRSRASRGGGFCKTKRYIGGVVHVDAQLDAREVQPVVREVQRRLHQCRSETLALPVVAYGHLDAADVTHAPSCRGGLQAESSDHLALHAGHQRIQTLRWLRETLAPRLGPRERHLQRVRYRPRAAEDAVDLSVIIRLRVTDGYVHVRSPFAYPCGVEQEPPPVGVGAQFARLVSETTWCVVLRPGWTPGSLVLFSRCQ